MHVSMHRTAGRACLVPPTSIANDARFPSDNPTQARITRSALALSENLDPDGHEFARALLVMI